jgi:hypothetical protein
MATEVSQTKKQTFNWSFVLFFLAVGFLFLWKETDLIRNTCELRKYGVPTKAVVTEVLQFKLITRNNIEFTTVIYNEKINTTLPVGVYLKKGDIVDILYSPNNPKIAMLANYSVFHATGFVALLSFIFVFLEIGYRFTSTKGS